MYKKLYQEIILKAKSENRIKHQGTYFESHHIVPDFMFKDRKRNGPKGHLDGNPEAVENKVLLTFQEHLMCHYYLYEIFKNTRYEYSAGSALQFFFIKATGNHKRQINLSEVDENFLNEMAFMREIGISSISKARKGTMPVEDAVTRKSMGSVPIDHPRVLSGEWVHHSKGKPGKGGKCQTGSENNNYKEMTQERKIRLFNLIPNSLKDNKVLHIAKLLIEIKKEFIEFKKISMVWILNNFDSYENLLNEYNAYYNTNYIHDSYYRIKKQKDQLTINKKYLWITNGIDSKKILSTDIEEFLLKNMSYRKGRK